MVQSEWGVNYGFNDLLAPGIMGLSVIIRSCAAPLQPLEEFIKAR